MNTNIIDALKHRRSYYAIGNKPVISDDEIESIINFAVTNVPSAFNSQSTRIVLLLGDNHKKLWDIAKQELQKIVPAEAFAASESKIDNSFASGYGTVLYFEDQDVVKSLQEAYPLYATNFPIWSEHTSAMHQLVVWTMLEDAGFGASVQHYSPLIDDAVCSTWNISKSWKLIAQMPFGNPLQAPGEKTHNPLNEQVKVFK